jgi:Sushi repeat (SCR repeat)
MPFCHAANRSDRRRLRNSISEESKKLSDRSLPRLIVQAERFNDKSFAPKINFHSNSVIPLSPLFPVCGPPAVPVNAKVQTTKSSSDGLSEARYECDSGYELFGPSTIRCDPAKGWEKELPFCGKLKQKKNHQSPREFRHSRRASLNPESCINETKSFLSRDLAARDCSSTGKKESAKSSPNRVSHSINLPDALFISSH